MEQPTSKACTKCGSIKPLGDFHKGRGKYGHKARCKPCQAADFADWCKTNPIRKKQVRPRGSRPNGKYNPIYYAATREIRLVRKAAYRARLKARTDDQLVADLARLRPDGLKVCNKCRTQHPVAMFGVNMGAADGLNDRCRLCIQAKQSRRLVDDATLDWWAQNGMDPETCTYCGTGINYLGRKPHAEPFNVDHIFPQSRGGTDDPENLAPSCAWCNRSKGANLLHRWLNAAA